MTVKARVSGNKQKLKFKRSDKFPGKVYVPQENGCPKKYPCKGCCFCQFCDESRCRICRKYGKCGRNKNGKDV